MEIQILHSLAVQLEPRLDVCVFRVTCGGIRISLLNFSRALPIDVREHWPKRDAKKGALRSAPAAPVRQRLGKLVDLTGEFHLKSINCRATAPVANRSTAGNAPALQFLDDFAD